MTTIPDKYLDLLQQKKAFASLATVMSDGSPQVTPVWFDYADGVVRVNTARGRVKARTLQKGCRSRSLSSIRTIRTAISRFAAASEGQRKKGQPSTSIRLQKNISGKTNIPLPGQARFGSCARSSRRRHPGWIERKASRCPETHGLGHRPCAGRCFFGPRMKPAIKGR